MYKIPYIFLFLIVFLHSNTGTAQPGKNNLKDKITNILTGIYRFQITKAGEDLSKLKTNNISDNQFYYLKASIQWWHILNGNIDENNQKLCLNYINKSLEAKSRDNNLDDQLTRISAYMLKMRVNNLGNHKIKSTILLLKILNLSETLINEMPESGQKNFLKGIYHYFTEYAKEESLFAKLLLFSYHNESKVKGLEYLEQASRDTNPVIRTEAHYLLYKIYGTLEKDSQKALENIEWLSKTYPENIFYKTEYYLTLCHNRLFSEADIVKNDLLRQVALSTELNEKEKKHYYISISKCQSNIQND